MEQFVADAGFSEAGNDVRVVTFKCNRETVMENGEMNWATAEVDSSLVSN